MKNGLVVPHKTKYTCTIWTYSSIPEIFKEMKVYVHINTCIQVFIAALFVTARSWKQPK